MLKKLMCSNEGNISVIMAFVLLLLMAVGGVIIDTGLVIEGKIKIHAATKAAAKATIEAYNHELWESDGIVVLDQSIAEEYAIQYLNYNLPEAQIISVTIPEDSPNKAIINTKLKIDFVFMKIFGIDECEVKSTITAICG